MSSQTHGPEPCASTNSATRAGQINPRNKFAIVNNTIDPQEWSMRVGIGILERIEQGIAKIVDLVFTKTFRSQIQPTELTSALKHKIDSTACLVPNRRSSDAPSHYVIEVSPRGGEHILSRADQLAKELSEFAKEHVRVQGYRYPGGIDVTVVPSKNLSRGFTIEVVNRSVAWRAFLIIGDKRYPIEQSVIIGRGLSADVRLADSSVSRQHAKIDVDGEKAMIVDIGSSNGFKVNGKRCTKATLKNNSLINLGRQKILFVFLPIFD